MSALWVTGDSLDIARQMPSGSVDLIVTSPPFLALRSYLPADDPAKPQEIGAEATPGEFLDVLLDLVVEWRRILAPHGSLCVELGDTYSGSGGGGGDYLDGGMREGQQQFSGSAASMRESNAAHWRAKNADKAGWPLAKSLTLIPQSFAWALAYGRNPHTGRTLEPWRVRNIVRWCRPNPPVGALGDKFRPATSEMTVACMSGRRYFDLDAVRVQHDHKPHVDNRGGHRREAIGGRTDQVMNPVDANGHRIQENPAGAPPLDFWVIPTSPYKGSHYATYPEQLVVKPVEAMCPRQVCTTCGEPSTRIVKVERIVEADDRQRATKASDYRLNSHDQAPEIGWEMSHETLGWSDCGHNTWRPGRVLDPFAGSGTTLAVAHGHGRTAIGIDLDRRNVVLARERIGPMFFTEVAAADLAPMLAPIGDAA